MGGGANKIWTTLQEDVDRMQYIIDVLQTSDGYGYPKSVEKWVESKLNKAILHFWPNFLPYLMVSYVGVLRSNEEKPCSIYPRIFPNPTPEF